MPERNINEEQIGKNKGVKKENLSIINSITGGYNIVFKPS